jgi:hypothetical protein
MARYAGMPQAATIQEKADALGVSITRLKIELRTRGLSASKHPDPIARDAALYAAVIHAPGVRHADLAIQLGITIAALRNGLERHRKRHDIPAPHPGEPVSERHSRDWEPLPAGSPETWGAISSDPWPRWKS